MSNRRTFIQQCDGSSHLFMAWHWTITRTAPPRSQSSARNRSGGMTLWKLADGTPIT